MKLSKGHVIHYSACLGDGCPILNANSLASNNNQLIYLHTQFPLKNLSFFVDTTILLMLMRHTLRLDTFRSPH